MSQDDIFHGAVVFFDDQDPGLEGFRWIVATTLEDQGQTVERQRMMSEDQAQVVSKSFSVHLQHDRGPRGNRLAVTVMARGLAGNNAERAHRLLEGMLRRMVDATAAKYVEWLDPATVLPGEKFMAAFSKMPAEDRFDPVDACVDEMATRCHVMEAHAEKQNHGTFSLSAERALAFAFRGMEEDALEEENESPAPKDNLVRRLTAWGMTGMLCFLSGPVAMSMAAVNLFNGADLRLNAQVLSFTLLIVGLTTSGAISEVVSILPF